jgi:hypothetical protein
MAHGASRGVRAATTRGGLETILASSNEEGSPTVGGACNGARACAAGAGPHKDISDKAGMAHQGRR